MPRQIVDCPEFETVEIFGRQLMLSPGFRLQPLSYIEWLATDRGLTSGIGLGSQAADAAEKALEFFVAAANPPAPTETTADGGEGQEHPRWRGVPLGAGAYTPDGADWLAVALRECPEDEGDLRAHAAWLEEIEAVKTALDALRAAARTVGELAYRRLCREVATELRDVCPDHFGEYVRAYRGSGDANGRFIRFAGV